MKNIWQCKYILITKNGYIVDGSDKLYLARRIAIAYQIKTGEDVNIIKQDSPQS